MLAADAFLKASRVPLDTVLSIAVAATSAVLSQRDRMYEEPNSHFTPLLDFRDAISRSKDPELLRSGFAAIAIDPAEIQRHLSGGAEREITEYGQEPFRSRPLIRIEQDVFLCSDETFLTQRLTVGARWMLREHLSTKEGEALAIAWGRLFERAIGSRVAASCGKRVYIPHPSIGGHELCDALMCYGGQWAFVEYKAITVTETAKHSGDPARLFSELEKKLLKRSTDGKSLQIVRALSAAFERRELTERELGRKLPSVVYPVIVSLDPCVASPLIERVLGDDLTRALAAAAIPAGVRIKPLTLLSAEDLVQTLPLLKSGL